MEITAIARDGKPIEPIRTRDAFRAQCGVLVRDKIPISIQQWLKPKKEDPEVSYVSDMQKEDLWTLLKENFTLPPEEDPEKPIKEQLIKSHALKKMAELFRRWKKELNKFVENNETPEFKGRYENIRDHWPAFVAHKTSEKSKKMSATNKQNAAKKKLHHRTGSGGYLVARPKWSKTENNLVHKGIKPETRRWPDSCRTWFFRVGGKLDPVTGKCIWTNDQMDIPVSKLKQYIEAAQEGTFFPDRENDELTMARQEDILSLNSRLLNRRELCDKLNERFGFNVSVEISSNDIRFSPYDPKMEVKRDGELYDSIDNDTEQQAGQTSEFAED